MSIRIRPGSPPLSKRYALVAANGLDYFIVNTRQEIAEDAAVVLLVLDHENARHSPSVIADILSARPPGAASRAPQRPAKTPRGGPQGPGRYNIGGPGRCA